MQQSLVDKLLNLQLWLRLTNPKTIRWENGHQQILIKYCSKNIQNTLVWAKSLISCLCQIRLRHLCKICFRSVCLDPAIDSESAVLYYTLHITTMSAPFYTSEHQSGENIDWNDLDTRKFPESIVNSCPGIVSLNKRRLNRSYSTNVLILCLLI